MVRQLQEIAECVRARNKCTHRIAKCLPKRGHAASACCSANYKYTCIEPSFLWKETPSTYEQLLTDFQKRKECNGKFFCLCEGLSVRPSLRTPRYAGTCCDSNSECQCCFTSSSVAKIPKPIQVLQTDECLAALQKGKCSSHVGNAEKDGGTHFCIKDETQMASACCEEGYRFYPCPNPTQELTWNTYSPIVETEECAATIKENCKCPYNATLSELHVCRWMKHHIFSAMRKAGYEEQTFQYVPQLLKLDAACCPRESLFVCCASRPKIMLLRPNLPQSQLNFMGPGTRCMREIEKHCKCPYPYNVTQSLHLHGCVWDPHSTPRQIDDYCCGDGFRDTPDTLKCCGHLPQLLSAGLQYAYYTTAGYRIAIVQLQPNVRKTDFAWQKPVSEQCKQKVENCSCGHASCIFTGAQKHDIIDICCEEQYEFKCCPDLDVNQLQILANIPTTVPQPAKRVDGTCTDKTAIKRICKTCDVYKCIRHEGVPASLCCAENYEFTCFEETVLNCDL